MRPPFKLPLGRRGIRREVDAELRFHLETRVDRLVRAGWTADAARAEALRQFGDVDSIRDSMIDLDEQRELATRRSAFAGEVKQDVTYALRALRRNFGFTAIVVGVLAVGIGANTAIFSLVDAVLMRPIAAKNPEELVAVGNPQSVNSLGTGNQRVDLLSTPLYRDIRDRNQVFSGVLASGRLGRVTARIDSSNGRVEYPRGRVVSANYFDVLGARPMLGRVFDATMDDQPGAFPFVVISHRYWTSRFNRDSAVIGRSMLLNDIRLSIVAVMPEEFTGEVVGAYPDVWVPLSMMDLIRPNQQYLEDRTTNWLLLLGRLKPGATLEAARGQITSLLEERIVANSTPDAALAFKSQPRIHFVDSGERGFSSVRGAFKTPLFTLMVGVALLLVIICANVANLLLARAIARGREIAVRLALGASRGRLVRQLLTESLVLAVLSAAVGLLVAMWGSRALLSLAADGGNIPLDLGMNGSMLAFTLLVSILAVGLFGLAPALRTSRLDLAPTMRAAASSVSGGTLGARGQRAPLGKMLIVGQVALSIVLLMAATMLVRSLRNLQSADAGLDRDHLLIVDVNMLGRGYAPPEYSRVTREIRNRLAVIPGVEAVSFSENGIFSGTESATNIQVPGFNANAADDSTVFSDLVGPDYIAALGARLLAGRDFEARDEDKAPRVALVNESMARFYFGTERVVGRHFRMNDSVTIEIVGVIADVRDHDLRGMPQRRAYFPYLHTPDPANVGEAYSLRFIVRSSLEPASLVAQARSAVTAVDPLLSIDGVDPLTNLIRATIRSEHLVARLATAFGVLALMLAAVGLYGVMTYAMSRRTGEIGLRMALGAQQTGIVRMVLTEALALVAAGVVVGVPLALLAARYLDTQLHNVPTADPLSIAVAVGVLTTSAVCAVTVPAIRASRTSPIVALRSE